MLFRNFHKSSLIQNILVGRIRADIDVSWNFKKRTPRKIFDTFDNFDAKFYRFLFFEKRKSTKWKCQNSSPAQCSHKDGSKLPMATALKAFKATKSSASRSRWFDAWPYMCCCCCCCIMCFPGEDKCFGPMGRS